MNTPYDTLGKATLSTYPVDEMGVFPVADFVTMTMPAAMTTMPMASRHQRSARCCFMLLLSVGGWGLGIVSEMVLPKPYIDCRHTGVSSQPNFFKKVEIRGCTVGSFPVIYNERATKYATRSLGSAGEHRLHTAGVTGSSPVLPTMHGAVVKSVITPACHAGGRGFKSLPLRHFLRTSFVEGVLFLCR